MSKDKHKELRQQAEELLSQQERRLDSLDRADLVQMAHELAVHQIELEIQNEELRLSRIEVEKARDLYLDLYDFAPVGYLTLDGHSRIVEANLEASRMLMKTRADLLKSRFTKFINPDHSQVFHFYRRKVMENKGRQTLEIKMQKADNTPFDAQLIGVRNGQERLRIALVNITERKKAEEMKDVFLGLVSHELRTPLTVISGSLKVALNKASSPEDVRELVQNAAENADLLNHMLENMLELTRHQTGRLRLNVEKVNVRTLAEKVIVKLNSNGAARQYHVEIPDDLPLITADPVRVERIIYNLLENADKYSPEESKIKLLSRLNGDFLVTTIID
ncbi:MAG: PAS domain-containing protein, partial [Actinobacteria bacterium]|nr:PAS domain-containing protein [Actinomycetota bacterium]